MDRHGVGQLSPEGAFQKLPIAESRFQDISSSNPHLIWVILHDHLTEEVPRKSEKKLLIQLLLNWDPHEKPHVNQLMGKLESQ